MPGVDQWTLTRYQLYLSQWLSSSSVKRFITLLVLFISLYYAYDRITRARRRELQQRAAQQLTGAPHTPPTRSLIQPSPLSSASSTTTTSSAASAPVQRLLTSLSSSVNGKTLPLSPTAKYLVPSKPQRLVVLSVRRVVLDEADRPIGRVLSLLRLLAQHTRLSHSPYTARDGTDGGRTEGTRQWRNPTHRVELGGQRVLFCSTAKGRSAMIRQLEPTLCVDDDVDVLSLIKPFIVDVVQISPTAEVPSTFTPPILSSLNAVPPPSASSSSSSSSSTLPSSSFSSPVRSERKVWTVPSLDVWFFGAAAMTVGERAEEGGPISPSVGLGPTS